MPNDPSNLSGPDLSASQISTRNYWAMRALVPDVSAQRLSYRDLVEMMAERGVTVSHSTILRWVQRYVPEFEKRWNRYARRVHSSWRMDETAVSVRGGSHYLYRAVDKHGKTVDSLLCTDRSVEAAKAFFCKASKTHQRPRKVNMDGNAASHKALQLLRQDSPQWRPVVVRSCRYLNNIVGAPGKVWRFQRVKIPHRQGASHPTGNRALGLWR